MAIPFSSLVARWIVIATPLSALGAQARGDLGAVEGRVVATSGPVSGAEVHVASDAMRDASASPLRALTDSGGRFAIRDVPTGTWNLHVRRLGFATHAQRIAVSREPTVSVIVVLREISSRLDTVTIAEKPLVPERYGPSSRMEEFYRRRARGRGTFFTREEIEKTGRTHMTDVLRLVPGARVRTMLGNQAHVTFARCLGPARLAHSGSLHAAARGNTGSATPGAVVFMNGARLDSVTAKEVLGELHLSEVEAIEVYRGVSELPMEAIGDACSAIFIWSRFGPGVDQAPRP